MVYSVKFLYQTTTTTQQGAARKCLHLKIGDNVIGVKLIRPRLLAYVLNLVLSF